MIGVPLDVGVGRGVGNLRNARIPQTRVIFARAGFSLGGDEWESGARLVPLARGRIAVSGRIRARHGAAELDVIRAIHMPTVPYARP